MVREYERGNRRQMAQRRRMGIAGICQGAFYIISVYSLLYFLQPSELCGPALSLQLLPFLERVPVQQQGLLRTRTRWKLLEAGQLIVDEKTPPPSTSNDVRGLSQARIFSDSFFEKTLIFLKCIKKMALTQSIFMEEVGSRPQEAYTNAAKNMFSVA